MKLRYLNALVAASILLASGPTRAGDNYLYGSVINMTTDASGIFIMLDTGVPTNCASSPYGWMQIKAANKTMIAVFLTMYALGKKVATVYTIPTPSGYCEITQYDPTE